MWKSVRRRVIHTKFNPHPSIYNSDREKYISRIYHNIKGYGFHLPACFNERLVKEAIRQHEVTGLLPLTYFGKELRYFFSKYSVDFLMPKKFRYYRNVISFFDVKSKVYLKDFKIPHFGIRESMTEIIKEGVPIPLSSVCGIVGRVKPKFSLRSKVKPARSLFSEFYYGYKGPKKKLDNWYERYSRIFSIAPGSYQFTQRLLDYFSKPPSVKLSKFEMDRGFHTFKHLLPDFKHKLDFPDYSEASRVFINPDAFPGYIASTYGNNRAEVAPILAPLAVEFFKTVSESKRLYVPNFLWTYGGREKRINHDDKFGKEATSRTIWMAEDLLVRSLSPFVSRLTNLFRLQPIDCAIHVAATLEEGNFEGFFNVYHKGRIFNETVPGWVIPLDYSKFDSNEYEEVISYAIMILSNYFELKDDRVKRIFFWILSSCVVKDLVLPETGLVYRFIKGLPSGHPFTSIVNSMVNFVIISSCLAKLSNKYGSLLKYIRFHCAGDDTLLFIPKQIPLHEVDNVLASSGMDIDKPSELAVWVGCTHDDHSPVFLKRCVSISGYGVRWNLAFLIENLICPNKPPAFNCIEDFDNERERAAGLVYHAPFCHNVNKILKGYITFVEAAKLRLFGNPNYLPIDWFKSREYLVMKGVNPNVAIKWFYPPAYLGNQGKTDLDYRRFMQISGSPNSKYSKYISRDENLGIMSSTLGELAKHCITNNSFGQRYNWCIVLDKLDPD